MSKKVSDELLSTVRAVIGEDYTDMDIIRALHMSNNDATAAINIIFDTPSFSSRNARPQVRENPRNNVDCRISNGNDPSSLNSAPTVDESEISDAKGDERSGDFKLERGDERSGGIKIINGVEERENKGSVGGEWWLVGCFEMSGMFTCKGRRIKAGDEVMFSFPSKSNATSPSPAKVFGRGRQASACSEIVRFSTKGGGEVSF